MKTILPFLILITYLTGMSSQVPKKAEAVSVNDTKIYYEVYGEGPPLLFLHGYSLSSKSWKPYVTDFEGFEIYLIDLTGHGNSQAFQKDLSIKEVAQDLNALIEYLDLEKIQAIGFSFGGDVLYQLALAKPHLISSMITIGALGSWDVNDFSEYQEGFTFENRANFPWLKTSHASDAQVKALMEQFKNYTVYLTDEEIQQIQPEVMIMMGDDDEGMHFDEVARMKKHLSRSDIWILPNVSHSAHEGENRHEFISKARKFLSK